MKAILLSASLALTLVAALPVPHARAAGCVKGAVVGGVAGHVAGHHGLLGAGAGCAVGHHEAAKHQHEHAQEARNNQHNDESR